MASCSVFEEDEIYAFDEQGFKIGLVLESSEYVSSDEDDDPDFDYDRVKRGTVRVAWHPNGGEELVAEKDVSIQHSINEKKNTAAHMSLCVVECVIP